MFLETHVTKGNILFFYEVEPHKCNVEVIATCTETFNTDELNMISRNHRIQKAQFL